MNQELKKCVEQYMRDESWDDICELLSRRSGEDERDAELYYYLGYAHWQAGRVEEAMAPLDRSLALNPEDDRILGLIGKCREAFQERMGHRQSDFTPERYTGEEMDAVEAHINAHFGEYQQVFHEIVSPDIHVDLCIIPPAKDREYYTVVTMGMGAHRMDVPAELKEYELERAELVIFLSSGWNVYSGEEEWYWPLRWLKALARMPGEQHTWLGWGHSVSNSGPFAENTALCACLLAEAQGFDQAGGICELPGGEKVNFYQVIPLYQEEMDFKNAHDAETLLKQMSFDMLVADPNRPNVCQESAKLGKTYYKSAEEITEMLETYEGPRGCLATDRITVDGRRVGYCYREEPMEGVPDSGWRFLAGDESDEYMEDSSHSGVYDLNTICNYDPDIFPLLNAPVGTAFARGENGRLELLTE